MSKRTLYREILKNLGFAFDFECVDAEGRPTTNVLEARPTLLSVASGKSKAIAETYGWDDETKRFLRHLLSQPRLVAVAHYGCYDYAVAHWSGCIDIRDIKATMMDTRLLAWFINEEDDLGLKELVYKYLGYRMTKFATTQNSPFYLKAMEIEAQMEAEKKLVERTMKEEDRKNKRALQEKIKRLRKEVDKDHLEDAIKEAIAASDEASLARAESLREELNTKLKKMQSLADEQRRIGDLTFRQYASDDAKQTWRLFKKLSSMVRHLNLGNWIDVELENYRQAIQMHCDGTYIDQKTGEEIIRTTRPLIEEFRAEIFRIAKQEFNLDSPLQVAQVIYRDLGVMPPAGIGRLDLPKAKDQPWGFKVNAEALERIDHPIGRAILNYKTLDTLDKNFLTGLPAQAKADPLGRSRVHSVFDSVGTVTGRWSSSTSTKG